MKQITRRQFVLLCLAAAAVPDTSMAETPREITWDDLIPPGVPYAEIIGEGELDEENDTWWPEYDANATRLNASLNGAYVRMPGYILPLEFQGDGVIEFILVPYVGACIHTPPPPPNQLVLVRTQDPWPGDALWDPVWVTGRMRTELLSTEVAEAGYSLNADSLVVYQW